MGILDDAIREHLELKRQHGAEATDLDRLEQEAFGPVRDRATRSSRRAISRPTPPSAGAAVGRARGVRRLAPGRGSDDRRRGSAARPAEPEAPAAEPESVEQPIPEAPEGAIFDVEDVDLAISSSATRTSPAEQARIEHSDLEDTVDHPAPHVESLSEELEAAAPTPPRSIPPSSRPSPRPPPRSPGRAIPRFPASTEEPESIEFDQLPGETVEAGTGEHLTGDR